MPESKHILQITAKAPSWGFDLFREISIALTDNGHQVTTVFINSAKDSPSGQVYGGDVIMLGLNNKNIFWRFTAIIHFIRIITAKKYHSIVCHHYKPSSLLAIIDRLIPQKRLFMINHNPNNLIRKGRILIVRYLFSHRWSYVGVSEWVRRDFLEKAFFLEPKRMHVLYNCIDIATIQANQLDRSEARNKLGIPQDAFVFGNIHRLDKSKGHDYMIRAFAKSSEAMPAAIAVIIGGGD